MRTFTFSRGHRVAKPPRGSGVSPRKLAQPRAPRRPWLEARFPGAPLTPKGSWGGWLRSLAPWGWAAPSASQPVPSVPPARCPGAGTCIQVCALFFRTFFRTEPRVCFTHSLLAERDPILARVGTPCLRGGPTPVPSTVPGNGHLRVTCVPKLHGDAPPSGPPPRAPPRDCDGPLQPSPPPHRLTAVPHTWGPPSWAGAASPPTRAGAPGRWVFGGWPPTFPNSTG